MNEIEINKRDRQLNKASGVFVKHKPSFAIKRPFSDRFGNTSFEIACKSRNELNEPSPRFSQQERRREGFNQYTFRTKSMTNDSDFHSIDLEERKGEDAKVDKDYDGQLSNQCNSDRLFFFFFRIFRIQKLTSPHRKYIDYYSDDKTC